MRKPEDCSQLDPYLQERLRRPDSSHVWLGGYPGIPLSVYPYASRPILEPGLYRTKQEVYIWQNFDGPHCGTFTAAIPEHRLFGAGRTVAEAALTLFRQPAQAFHPVTIEQLVCECKAPQLIQGTIHNNVLNIPDHNLRISLFSRY